MKVRQVGIVLYPGVEALDFAGPFEVFTTASRVARRLGHAVTPFQVRALACTPAPVRARAGLKIVPDAVLGAGPALDVLVVPGGDEVAERGNLALLAWLRSVAPTLEVLASVCTGAFLLAAAGLLDGRRVTTHWEDADELARCHPLLTVEQGARWIDQGDLVTSAGISAGIDMALHLVARLTNEALAVATARQMDYPWRPEP